MRHQSAEVSAPRLLFVFAIHSGDKLRKVSGLFSGVLDSGFAALANFAMGLFAVRTFGTDSLALYSLFFSGTLVAQLIPAQMAYFPARLSINTSINVVGPRIWLDFRRGIVPIILAAILVAFAGLPLLSTAPGGAYLLVAASAGALTISAPLNAHLRACLHILGNHGSAAVCSAVTAGGAIFFLLIWHLLNGGEQKYAGTVAVAFGTLAVANLAGTICAVAILQNVERGSYELPSVLTRVGYLGPDLVAQASGYFVNVVTNGLLGTAALAMLETARIMASPMLVIITGLATYFIPTTVRLFAQAEMVRFRRRLVGMTVAVVATGALYAGAVMLFGHTISQALGKHAVPSLGASRSIASTLESSAGGAGTIMYTARRSLLWNIVSATGSLLALALVVPAVAMAGILGVPLAQTIGSAFKSGLGLSIAYRSKPPAQNGKIT